MSLPTATHARARGRWQSVLLILLCAGIVLIVWGQRRTVRVQRVVAGIEQCGGAVEPGTSAWTRLWDRVRGWSGAAPTRVRLAQGTTAEWLRSWDGLTDLSIGELTVDRPEPLGPELAALAERHPLEVLHAAGATAADELAEALSASGTLRELNLRDSDLTEAGLRALPLERLRQLNIAGTPVTLDGLRELRRLPPISMIVLDGGQVSGETIAMLEQNLNPYRLWLYGSEVTDDTLATLKVALASEAKPRLMTVYVGQRLVTASALLAWQRDVPSVRIASTRRDEPGPSLRSRGFSPRPWTRWIGR